MSRLVWMGVGAAGGIFVYRRSQRSWERTKARGVAGNTAVLTRTAAQIYRGIRDAEKPEALDLTDTATTARVEPVRVIEPRDAQPGGRQGSRASA